MPNEADSRQGDSLGLVRLDLILELLDEKNDWCDLEEIATKAKSSELETRSLLDFLAEYGFAIIDINNRRARITPRIHEFLQEVRQVEMEESTSLHESEETFLSNCRTPEEKTALSQ